MLKNRARGSGQREGGEKAKGDPDQGGKMGDRKAAEPAAGVKREGVHLGFDWAGFFRNPRVMLQIILYVLLFYTIAPRPLKVVHPLVWLLLLLPLFVLNLMGTHLLTELAAKREKQANVRVGPNLLIGKDNYEGHISG